MTTKSVKLHIEVLANMLTNNTPTPSKTKELYDQCKRAALHETYWYCSEHTPSIPRRTIDCYIPEDNARYNSGNYFLTEEEARNTIISDNLSGYMS